ncbi:MAG: Clp protease ATP-binding protein [Candidatus Saccharibacteria bacterium]|nr:Clp protease ATP-binding protein [Candidatus Saccharibacteria bacterium]
MTPDLGNIRAKKARLGKRIGPIGYDMLRGGMAAGTIATIILFILSLPNLACVAIFFSLLCLVPAAWYRLELHELPTNSESLTGRLDRHLLARLEPGRDMTPLTIWQDIKGYWQNFFVIDHLFIHGDALDDHLSQEPADTAAVWSTAAELAGSQPIQAGHVSAALLLTTPSLQPYLQSIKVDTDTIKAVTGWLDRLLESRHVSRPYFGGVGRDWANGFTPRLNQFGHNISLDIEAHGAHFGWLTTSPGVQAIKTAFSQGTAAVALIGDDGVGKTSHVDALAQVLLQEQTDRNLEHRQIIALNPSVILSHASHPGDLEHLLLLLLNEAAHAGHIILFFDDAHLFFQDGHGAVDLSQILLPVVQSHQVQMIFAMTPRDLQQLKTTNGTLANLLTPISLQEPPVDQVMRVLEDAAIRLERRHDVLITYEALAEVYRLSGRYDQDTAYPGKALKVLEQAMAHADHQLVNAASVQAAIEQTRGVKVSTASVAETDQLLNLEDAIHERMINQSQAVSVVASALRRARAGIANPRRPIGSFLFLGPTGVGKTELAKAVAATFFGSEDNIIRLDMSEYQQPDDVQRLLSNGANESKSLILAVRQRPYAVVLLDELEKAHPNILNLLLQLLDEGQLTDMEGRAASFKDCVIIATSNAGANRIRDAVSANQPLDEAFERELTDELINAGQYKPELLNRFDEVVLFRPLEAAELLQIVDLMMKEINQNLANQHITVQLTRPAAEKIVEKGYDIRLGARPLRRVLQRAVEDTIADKILRGEATAGTNLTLDVADLKL